MTISQQLAAYGRSISWRELPPAVQWRARLCLLDMLGATLAGAATPTASVGAALAARWGNGEAAHLLGRSQRASVPLAALANGMTCHALEMDDGHRYAIGLHNACTTTPAAMALAEEQGAALEELLAALVVGYEVAGRVGSAINPAHRQRGFHSTGTVGVFGAAAAAAYLRDLPVEKFTWALGIAGSASGGIFAFLSDGSTSKHFHAGHAALSGVLAAELAAGGMTGPLAIFEDREGFCRVYGGDVDPAVITRGLGERFELEHVYFKLHAACGHTFAPIDAALELRTAAGAGAEVEHVLVRTYGAAAILDERQPRTRAAAKFSIPYCVAAAWLHGDVSEPRFTERSLADPALLALAARVDTMEDPELQADFPRTRAARLEVALRDGRRLDTCVDLPRGMPERPATDDELLAKFRGLAEPVVGVAATTALCEKVLSGGHVPVHQLVALCTPRAAASAAREGVSVATG